MDSFHQRRSRHPDVAFDIMRRLESDVAVKILEHIDNPIVLMRATAVSRYWQRLVISNQVFRTLCLRLFPQLFRVITDPTYTEKLQHDIFANLAGWFTIPATSHCIRDALWASSTHIFPKESILNTLYPWDKVSCGPCYWSSEGNSITEMSETLTYRLLSKLFVVSEIYIKPYRATFQDDSPIYSSRAVRFKMGHLNLAADGEHIAWTYTSPDFPMDQDGRLQRFELPVPVLCIGAYLQIELLDGVQKQTVDNLYYICVSHVKVIGQPLSPKFDVEILEPSGNFLLRYFPENHEPPPVSRYSQIIDSAEPILEDDADEVFHFYCLLNPQQ